MRTRHIANALASMAQDHPLHDLRLYKAAHNNMVAALFDCERAFGTDEEKLARLRVELAEIDADLNAERERLQIRASAAIGCEIHELREIL